MIRSPFQPTLKEFMKYLLIIFALLKLTYSTVYAEDSWYSIDGIKFRYGYSVREQSLSIKDQKIASTSPQLDPNQYGAMGGRQLLPIIITFPETLMNSWSFRQAYFDFSLNEKYDDVPPDDLITGSRTNTINSAIAEKQDSVLFKIKESTKNHLKNEYLKNFLSTAEINDLPENWAISYDLQNSSILLGYLWGIFYPIGGKHRILKLGFGWGIGWSENNADILLCDSYTVILNYKDKINKVGSDKPHEGKCINPRTIQKVSFVDFPLTSGLYVTIWERVTEDSIFAIGKVDRSTIQSVYRSGKLKNVKFEAAFTSGELISYTYRF